ncbi:hypothetical protein [Methanococcoides seepicolus]|uniref:Uncharacterized protein n=1 Tax=Methanococcoides seepicolus TaxID=2828780 RepID=A0A9E4ZH40_9EURY|nr:hypothetical protein [Methanococcoides seepicolus]MCM1987562.1 hypothetical protein [Methanococcoides seepicolus]
MKGRRSSMNLGLFFLLMCHPLHIKIDESRRYDTAVFENIRQVMDKGITIYEEEGWV